MPFKHRPLNLDRTQIRLFRLIPTERSGDLAGVITAYDFENCPEYRAVSYTWGPPDPTREISIEGQVLPIRENLWQFLDVARNLLEDWLWIDQVCINKSAVDERNHQVGLM
ncbi:heterokaryon incompatibility protein-domain-containing protein, partial [Rhexocercosporidium sp. MPI-PUGE-AT-0058]